MIVRAAQNSTLVVRSAPTVSGVEVRDIVSEMTRQHERAVSEYQRQVYPAIMKMPRPYDWRARARYEVEHNIITTQATELVHAR